MEREGPSVAVVVVIIVGVLLLAVVAVGMVGIGSFGESIIRNTTPVVVEERAPETTDSTP